MNGHEDLNSTNRVHKVTNAQIILDEEYFFSCRHLKEKQMITNRRRIGTFFWDIKKELIADGYHSNRVNIAAFYYVINKNIKEFLCLFMFSS